MLAPLQLIEQLRARLREALAGEDPAHASGVLSLTLALPHRLQTAPDLAGPRFQFTHGHRSELRAGYGVAAEWQTSGPRRLEQLRERAHALAADWRQLDPDETGFSSFAMLGFAAAPDPDPDELPNALLWLPEVALYSHEEQAALVLSAALPERPETLLARWEHWLERLVPLLNQPSVEPLAPTPLQPGESEPDLAGWRALVFSALDAIERDELQKVVLCRRLRLHGAHPFDLGRINAALGYLFPSCQVVNLRRHEATFVAATPERLFTLRGQRVEADAIAGTARRDADAARDAALGEELRRCPKNLHEHQLVVEAVRAALAESCQQLDAPEGPRLLGLNNAQHLRTLLHGTLRAGEDILSLAERLHPTPATNGQPRRAAHRWLRASEPFTRGWYSGAAGILTPDLGGELWVLLRCARIQGAEAELYAGAGIVPGSDPDSEWEETAHKFAAIATALQFA
ncbi:MAG: isochorismate synthase [Chromatiaceae bacterium]|nr:isochorismate synthase [Chromatiaceae bacterium]